MDFKKYNYLYSLYSDVVTNIIVIIVQGYSLLFLNWSGLYVVYLFWIDLLFMAIYTVIRNWQFNKLEEWKAFKIVRSYLFDKEMDMFIFMRVLTLAFYLLMIGVTAIPYEHSYSLNEYHEMSYTMQEVKSVADFFTGLFIADPVFIASVSFIVMYYLKLLFAKPDTSTEGMIEFSFNIASKDPRYLCPLLALLTLPFPLIATLVVGYEDNQTHSFLYVYALWLLMLRFSINMIMIHTLKTELEKKIEV